MHAREFCKLCDLLLKLVSLLLHGLLALPMLLDRLLHFLL
jgi:hypothetical protein